MRIPHQTIPTESDKNNHNWIGLFLSNVRSMEIRKMKLEPTFSVRPPRKKKNEVVKEKIDTQTDIMRFVKEDKEIKREE